MWPKTKDKMLTLEITNEHIYEQPKENIVISPKQNVFQIYPKSMAPSHVYLYALTLLDTKRHILD
jgi:hypothetical protein